MGILKRIAYNWLVRGKWILMLSLVLAMVLAAITFFQKQPKKYVARVYGCTSLLNYNSVYDYLSPVIIALRDDKKEIAARYFEIPLSDFKYLTDINIDRVNQVVEEADIRYEFLISAEFLIDTVGAHHIERGLINFLKRNSLLITKCTEKTKAFAQDKLIMKNEIARIDSLLSSFNDKNTVYYENLRQRKVDLSLQLNKYAEKYDEFYDLKEFYGFDKSGQWIQDESKWVRMFVYYLVGFGIFSFVFAIFRDKGLVRDIISSFRKLGFIE